TELKGKMLGKLDVIKQQLLAKGDIEKVGVSDFYVFHIYSNSGGFSWEGKDPNSTVLIGMISADSEFAPSLGMEILEGRNFYSDLEKERESVLINETLAKMIQPDGMVTGQTIDFGGEQGTVVGVVKDFVHNDIYT